MNKGFSRSIVSLGAIGALALIFYFAWSHLQRPPFTVTWKNERLSVIAEKAPLSDILQEVHRQVGLKSSATERLHDKISIRFYELPLDEGIRRLLALAHNGEWESAADDQPFSKRSTSGLVQKDAGQTNGAYKKTTDAENDLLEDSALNAADANSRLASIQQLIANDGNSVTEVLYLAAEDPDPSIRQLAYQELHRRDQALAIDILVQHGASDDNDIRFVAIESAVELLGVEAIEMLRTATDDTDASIRQMAFQKLAQIEGDQALELLRERLLDADAEVRIMAIEAMASKGATFANEAALATLHDNDELVLGKAEGLLDELEATRQGQSD
ncbi:MAG: HEAT repeat domain-containing protein [Gammaproteobacteria bacterium]